MGRAFAVAETAVKAHACILSKPAIASQIDMVEDAGSSAQRIRIGLTGLAFAFLLVLLGSAISRSGSDDSPPNAAQQAEREPSEPLAELGVAPGGNSTQSNSTNQQ